MKDTQFTAWLQVMEEWAAEQQWNVVFVASCEASALRLQKIIDAETGRGPK